MQVSQALDLCMVHPQACPGRGRSGSQAVTRALTDDERHGVVGVVPQVVQLFNGTVWENVTLWDDAAPRATVERAVEIAGAGTLVEALAQGYDTSLSGTGRGGGTELSAGQRQLLGLARALVADPAVLLLDEATDAIDSVSDAAFLQALRADVVRHRRAVVTVAHRLATARMADLVIVIEGADRGRRAAGGPDRAGWAVRGAGGAGGGGMGLAGGTDHEEGW